jgi:hypothetical protein
VPYKGGHIYAKIEKQSVPVPVRIRDDACHKGVDLVRFVERQRIARVHNGVTEIKGGVIMQKSKNRAFLCLFAGMCALAIAPVILVLIQLQSWQIGESQGFMASVLDVAWQRVALVAFMLAVNFAAMFGNVRALRKSREQVSVKVGFLMSVVGLLLTAATVISLAVLFGWM